MKPARMVAGNGIIETAKRKKMCIQERLRSERVQRQPEVLFAVNRLHRGRAQIQDQQGHDHCEHAIAESRQALHALSGDAVLGGAHFRPV